MWRNPYATVGKNVNGAAAMENSMEVPQKFLNWITKWLSNPTSGNVSKRLIIDLEEIFANPYS